LGTLKLGILVGMKAASDQLYTPETGALWGQRKTRGLLEVTYGDLTAQTRSGRRRLDWDV